MRTEPIEVLDVLTASIIAHLAHKGQVDDEGIPYIEHVKQVHSIICDVAPSDYVLRVAAYLHDVIEDTDETYDNILDMFGQEVADLVMEVTHEGQADSYGYYFPRLHSKRGIMLKFADRLSNLSRMGAWDTQRQEQYMRRSKFWKDGSDRK